LLKLLARLVVLALQLDWPQLLHALEDITVKIGQLHPLLAHPGLLQELE
jgi:hypothetical protein